MISIGTKEIVQRMVDNQNVDMTKKLATEIVNEFYEAVAGLLPQVDSIKIGKLGTFKVNIKRAHVGRNPKTGESVQVPEKTVLRFTPSKTIKDLVNKE